MDEVGFRPLDVSDVCFLARYAAECDGITEDSEIRLIEERTGNRLKEPSYLGVVALDKGRQIGYVDGIVEGSRLVLGEIYVEQSYRSRGIGKRLIEEITAQARPQGIANVAFHTELDNVPMRRLGKRLGFNLRHLYDEKRLGA